MIIFVICNAGGQTPPSKMELEYMTFPPCMSDTYGQ